ncbi:MAG: 16S rRNA (guanine(527)-N(7))-methyltransferase RsmG [Bacillota bacterium]|nr:16S rRNA (guanine(527)-N(7))-methyltransferase RsmG [Bacillota bacterium]
MSIFQDSLRDAINITSINNLTLGQFKQFEDYYYMLIEWNNKINLTAITKPNEVIEKHFVDSLLVSSTEFFNFKQLDANIIDIGTGAGFPGIPLKVVFPSIKVTLLDSLNKRIIFLENVIKTLGLNQINCIHGRAEDIGRDLNHREKYSIALSRAVAYLPILIELCIPFIKKGGYFIAYKGSEVGKEIDESDKALRELGAKIVDVRKFQLPYSGDFRSLVVIEKVEPTNIKYPRRAGIPVKKPLV